MQTTQADYRIDMAVFDGRSSEYVHNPTAAPRYNSPASTTGEISVSNRLASGAEIPNRAAASSPYVAPRRSKGWVGFMGMRYRMRLLTVHIVAHQTARH